MATGSGFYNPYLKLFKNRSSNWNGKSTRVEHSYYTDISEFRFIAPKCLDEDGSCVRGTHIGSIQRQPKIYYRGNEMNILNFSSDDSPWPVRMRVWNGMSFLPEGYNPRFEKFHVYDLIETVETASSSDGRLTERFIETLRPSGTVVTLLGLSECGKRVTIHVYGVCQYFYMNKAEIDAACGSRTPRDLAEKMASVLRTSICGSEGQTTNGSRNHGNGWGGGRYGGAFRTASAECFDIDIVEKTDVYYYETKPSLFYRVRVRNGKFVPFLCDNFYPDIKKYEGNVDAVTRFILDNPGFTTFGWYKLKPGKNGERVQVRRTEHHSTSSDVEINCTVDNLEFVNDDSWPEYKLLCYDIECKAGGGNELAFPVASNQEDVVIQISCLLYSMKSRKLENVLLFSLGSCDLSEKFNEECMRAGIPEPAVLEFASEFELLLAFITFIKQYSPEFVTGYNIVNFDWAYIYNKLSSVYKVQLDGYGKLNQGGLFKVWDIGQNHFQKRSKVKINGVISLDMYSVATDKLKLPSYKLDAVAEAALGERKKDLSYKDIPKFFASGPSERGHIGEYCIQDSLLVGKLFFKYLPHLELSAVAKLAGITLTRVIFDGQQIRVFTCLLRLAGERGFILPYIGGRFGERGERSVDNHGDESKLQNIEHEDSSDDEDSNCADDVSKSQSVSGKGSKSAGGRVVGYQGAKVLDPISGFHIDPVVVFDFASLYPSIMQAHNLCYSTLSLDRDAMAGLTPVEDYLEIEVGGQILFFVRSHIRESLLSILLKDWLAMRKAIRARIPESTEEQAVLLDKQQAAIKVVCNSVYGFTGVASGILPCLPVAATVTTIGRNMLLATREYVHDRWATLDKLSAEFQDVESTVIDGAAYSVRIIYGDTDSVFVRFNGLDADKISRLGDAMAKRITADLFKAPIKLECEKTFTKLLLITKKKYIGTICGGKMLMKGVDLVRKNNCKFINSYARRLVDLLFRNEEVAAAAAEITRSPHLTWLNRPLPEGLNAFGEALVEAYLRITDDGLDVNDFIMTAELSRSPEAYTNKRIPHLTVYYKLMNREEQLPSVKERISYVIVAQTPEVEAEADAVARLRGDSNRCVKPENGLGAVTKKKRKMLVSELAEDPVYAVAKSIPLNTDYYFSHLLSTLSVTFKALFGNDVKTTEILFKRFIPETSNVEVTTMSKFERAGFCVVRGPSRDMLTEEENRRTLHTAFCILTEVPRPS
ncbi:DNA polymerase catalytic subunit [Spheniscid alphaherpesvirus 1]|uniref:DNA polymerase n=1 Tax=Spheniscid alphaherpesvirus 1 TaxID=2560777 RepID=A0A1R3T889_9ALPH|nr:DNA polymerase catalytic subunit [Spheniscid alphaherpesvirus 1]